MSDVSSEPKVNWGPLAAVAGTVGGYLVSQFTALLLLIFVVTQFSDYEASDYEVFMQQPGYIFLANVLFAASLLCFTAWFIKLRGGNRLSIGLNRPRVGFIGLAAIGFLVYYAASIVATLIIEARAPHWLSQEQDLGFSRTSQGPALSLIFISLVVLPPLVEEVLFRGFLFTGLRRRLDLVWSTMITSVLFAAAHLLGGETSALLWVLAVDTFLLSVVLCYIRERSGSLWPAIFLHAIKNGLAFLVIFVFN